MQTLQSRLKKKVQLHVILLGMAGSVYTEHTLGPLRELGVSQQQTRRLVNKLHRHAATHAVAIVGHRRCSQSQSQPPDRVCSGT